MLQINPDLTWIALPAPTMKKTVQLFWEPADYLIDAIDLPDKIHLIETCLSRDIPIISSMGTANRLNPLMLTIADTKIPRSVL